MAAAGREEGKLQGNSSSSSCLPSNRSSRNQQQQQQQQQYNKSSNSAAADMKNNNYTLHPLDHLPLLRPKSGHRPRHPNWVASASGGMRAIFLDSRHKPSTGTGVFLPRNAAAPDSLPNNHSSACSPVLLPARVVQALNLNVNHIIALQVTRRHQLDAKSSSKPGRINNPPAAARHNNSTTVEPQQNENSSPEIFLPKEWTY